MASATALMPADDVSMRVIADHARATSFLLSDGVMPANDGRGYVLRRIIRRAARHGKMLGFTEPFLHKVLGVVADVMGNAYPELTTSRVFAADVILHEEERFGETLETGLQVLAKVADDTRQGGKTVIPGEEVFKLYDTYGFPLDLAEEIVQDQGLTLDMAGFDQAMDRQREMARAAWKGSGDAPVKSVYPTLVERLGHTRFLGYDSLEAQGRVLAILNEDQLVEQAEEGDEIELVIDQTPFYAEGGGQVGDTGLLVSPNVVLEVKNTQRPVDGLIVPSRPGHPWPCAPARCAAGTRRGTPPAGHRAESYGYAYAACHAPTGVRRPCQASRLPGCP